MGKTTISLFLVALLCTAAYSQGLVLKHMEIFSNTSTPNIWPTNPYGIKSEYFDLDRNGVRDLVLSGESIEVRGMPGNTILWTSPESEIVTSYPVFADLSGDGFADAIYFSSCSRACLRVFSIQDNQCILSADSIGLHGADYFISDFDNDGLDDLFYIVDTYVGGEQFGRLEVWGAGEVVSRPPGLLTINGESGDLILRWQEVDSCSMYMVEWAIAPTDSFVKIGETCLPTFRHAGAAIVPRATYRVRAITSTGNEPTTIEATYSMQSAKIGKQ